MEEMGSVKFIETSLFCLNSWNKFVFIYHYLIIIFFKLCVWSAFCVDFWSIT